MRQKKVGKSKAARMKDLPAKTVTAKTAKGVKGGEHSEAEALAKQQQILNDMQKSVIRSL